jgi:putative CocE/NonD family hydrolase
METDVSLPCQTRVIENLFIPMPDGTRLAARIWLPVDAEQNPVPAIMEYIPYRKRDVTRARDSVNHPYMAGHGYACVRVDMRGSGDSEGVLTDEYTREEKEDGVNAIAWIADQPWCDGNVGMMGISWGGFNSLQVAAERPPALKAIISACSSDDLYVDNMHYMGGCLLGDNLSEATVMFAFNSLPPDPDIAGERWRELWFERLKGSGLWLESWLRHQRRTAYWKASSIRENYAAIQCPVYAVGGWADGFTNTIFRLLEHLEVPRKGLIGPWAHKYPHQGVPGPAVGFLQEAVRWWDYWLKGRENGVMDGPMLRAWEQDSMPPNRTYENRPGRWVGEQTWPSPHIEEACYTLAPHRLVPEHSPVQDTSSQQQAILEVRSPLSLGINAGKWCSYAATPDLPGDQREEDGGALVFETRPLSQGLHIFGQPSVELDLAADQPFAMVAVRLSDVAPDGETTRVTYGLLNLTHRDSHETPERLEPYQYYRVRVDMNGIAQHFPPGHRLRLSISSSYWPLAWTPPAPVTLMVAMQSSSLRLPARPPRDEDAQLPAMAMPEGSPPLSVEPLQPGEHEWRVLRELADNVTTLEVTNNDGTFRLPDIGTEITRNTREWYSIQLDDVLSSRGETYTQRAFKRDDWDIEVITRTVLTCDAEHFEIAAELDAYEAGRRVYSQNWHHAIPRDFI